MDTIPVDKSPDTTLSNNRRIAKNTLMLYVRMLFSMVVSLYTSRVVLNTLGVEDYGIYGVVGGVVSMFSFLNASMSGATSRFLTFEMGKGDFQRLKETFSSALMIHIGIALLVLLLAETVGLWFLNHKLVIPEERMSAAQWVYQLSILSMVVGVTQVPYNASIIAHEKMDVYAYVEILNVTLKLLIVYLLTVGQFDKLIFYAVLVFVVSVIVAFTYRIYCLRKFDECRFHWVWKPEILKPMMSFSGWDLYGNMCYIGRTQGINFLLNMFFGVTLNAANNIVSTVNGFILGFAGNVLNAFKPSIIKIYAQNDSSLFQRTFENVTKYFSLLLVLISIPFYLEIDYILQLWLGGVPLFTNDFCRIILVTNSITMPAIAVTVAIHATGRIKIPSFIIGSFYLLIVVISYICLKMGTGVYTVYIVNGVLVIMSMLANFYLLKQRILYFNIQRFVRKAVFPVYILAVITFMITLFVRNSLEEGFFRLLSVLFVSFLSLSALSLCLLLSKDERIYIKRMVCNYIRRY